jgi:nicotinate-nucleotide pyrophosphorylase
MRRYLAVKAYTSLSSVLLSSLIVCIASVRDDALAKISLLLARRSNPTLAGLDIPKISLTRGAGSNHRMTLKSMPMVIYIQSHRS